MKTLLFVATLSLFGAGAAYAAPQTTDAPPADAAAPAATADANVPLCSRTVRDKCMNPSEARHHKATHGKAKKTAAKKK
ncbi:MULTISPECIES: hypothetical protein [Sphingomonadales]|uniref:Phosphate starvation-inducible protein PsiF n=1 Tax=Edaphosphingomonas haloaromaticamans TaxID=653954 RepID=A0A1S1HGJ4_9SPHN|nr:MULTISPECIES: hypothetical protein [Sphingomonas]AGH47945.1 hypothetical protein G432_01085 [Sphingomonas sp. MM-1]OHT20343.1 hypothetical protein BHE75_02341 [Sphingomonas haloaromaticamans]